jgi:Uma2 family endonuclease
MAIDTTFKIGGMTLTGQNRLPQDLPIVPPLENGDHLTRAEFERRYHTMPWLKKAELVEGVVYMGSPVRFDVHAEPHGLIVTLLGLYRISTPGVKIGDNGTLRLDMDNEPQPDVMLCLDPSVGGASWITEDGYIEGSPELVVEIAASSATYDLREKRTVYRRNGVREYAIWQIYDHRFDWWILREGEYQSLTPDNAGVFRSEVFPGLWLDAFALLTDNLPKALATMQQGLASDEHAAFVARLTAQLSKAEQ